MTPYAEYLDLLMEVKRDEDLSELEGRGILMHLHDYKKRRCVFSRNKHVRNDSNVTTVHVPDRLALNPEQFPESDDIPVSKQEQIRERVSNINLPSRVGERGNVKDGGLDPSSHYVGQHPSFSEWSLRCSIESEVLLKCAEVMTYDHHDCSPAAVRKKLIIR
ncbi:hypothetical protein TELCIR_03336 [Teladorsagia circumcincta]|uniref:Uncharacterized protein n=1 Tax=Teladorsagia circumcincta TaxID=45464 RepID=A0A2G9UWP6_TELCI|nr:hypothetical protein TELCIR_03336 [Teladorsagia circumcincta]